MATKRAAPLVHPSRQDQVPDEPRRKRQKPEHASSKSFKKAHPVNDLKSQVRSLKRLLERNDDLPANVRVEKERALQSAQHELEETQRAKKRSEMIGKYHKIRFFDRQKATKRLKRARKELQGCEHASDKRAELEKRVKDAEVDVDYAQYFPLDQNYVSLFPRKQDDGSGEGDRDSLDGQSPAAERKGDVGMWERVKQCMADGTLDALRNGKMTDVERSEEHAVLMLSSAKGQQRKRRGDVRGHAAKRNASTKSPAGGRSESDDESEGGFFE